MGNPAEERPPPSVTSVPKLVPVVKPLARLPDRVIVPCAANTSRLVHDQKGQLTKNLRAAQMMVLPANVQDRDGARQLLKRCSGMYKTLRLIWADGGYAGKLVRACPKSGVFSNSISNAVI